jgi:hypothetical protein
MREAFAGRFVAGVVLFVLIVFGVGWGTAFGAVRPNVTPIGPGLPGGYTCAAPPCPAATVYACLDVAPDNGCDGPLGAAWVSIGDVVPEEYVLEGYGNSNGQVGDCSSLGFQPLYQLPQGGFVTVGDASGFAPINGACQAGSLFTFGLGVPYTPAFDISQLNSTQMGQAFAAGFLLIGVAMATGKGIGLVLSMFRS